MIRLTMPVLLPDPVVACFAQDARQRRPGGSNMMERVLSWALGLTLAVLLLVVAFLQMSGPTPNPIFGMIAARSHIGLFEPYGRYLVALLEIAAVVLVVYPRTRPKGAILALVVALGAILLHLSPWLGVQ